MPLKRIFTFLLTLPCLALSANEVGLESTSPSRFGAKFTESNGKVTAEFNGDKGVFARMMEGLASKAAVPKTVMIDATYLKAHRTATSLRSKKRGLTTNVDG